MASEELQFIHIYELVEKESSHKIKFRDQFDCGKESLNDFIKKFARKNSEEDLNQSWVLWDETKLSIVGYYSLLATSICFYRKWSSDVIECFKF